MNHEEHESLNRFIRKWEFKKIFTTKNISFLKVIAGRGTEWLSWINRRKGITFIKCLIHVSMDVLMDV